MSLRDISSVGQHVSTVVFLRREHPCNPVVVVDSLHAFRGERRVVVE
jgi:D-serine deaminase-like pyridoxal phosphate-dependent protein